VVKSHPSRIVGLHHGDLPLQRDEAVAIGLARNELALVLRNLLAELQNLVRKLPDFALEKSHVTV
jgi:hypothetical protein